MQICQEHWTAMKEAVKSRGMWHLVAQSTEECIRRQNILSDAPGTDDADGFGEHEESAETLRAWDPLMAMNWNFLQRAVQLGGTYLLCEAVEPEGFVNDKGERHFCPLCEVKIHMTSDKGEVDEIWIETCADSMKTYAIEHNLLQLN